MPGGVNQTGEPGSCIKPPNVEIDEAMGDTEMKTENRIDSKLSK